MTTLTAPRRPKPPVFGDPTTAYAEAVVAGEIIVGHLVRLACERHLADLADPDNGLVFDLDAAGRALRFFGHLRQSKGEWAGLPLVLQPWQEFILGNLFGWKQQADGLRRFRVAYVEVPRKNGKSLLAAGIGLYLAFYDGEGGAEVYCAATKLDQAKIVFSDARAIVLASSHMKRRITVPKTERAGGAMFDETTRSKLEPLGQDSDSLDGLNIHGVVVDELHAHKTRGMWDVLQTATGARRQPLTCAITTAGWNRHSVCYEQHAYGRQILDGVLRDDTFFAFIASWDEDDDWEDEESWRKANPNYGVSVKPDDLRRKAEKAKQIPGEQNAFLRLHGDVWTEQETRWLDMGVWDENADKVDVVALRGRPCFAGIDLSSTTDISAVELYFPNLGADAEGGDWLHFYFVPKENMRRRAERDRVPYPLWAEQGLLTATPGNVVDYGYIREKLNVLLEAGFEIQEVAYDPWNATSLVTDLMSDGFKCVPVRQGFASLTAPTKEFEKLLLGRKFRGLGHPVARWAASNVMVEQDAAGNLKPSKVKSTERIDPIVAMVLALDRATRQAENLSVYTERGFLEL